MSGDLTVIMPARDTRQYIGEAIDSVLGADGLLEVLVVDDGSTDGTGAVAAAFGDPVRVITTPPRGVAAARNRAVGEARGALLGFLDSDDIWVCPTPDPRRAALAADPTLDVAMGQLQRVAMREGALHEVLEPFPGTGMCAGLFRREAFERVGGFDERLASGEDFDWFARARERDLRMQVLDDLVIRYRLRSGSLTRDAQTSQHGVLTSLRGAVLRRREEAR